MNFIFFHFFWIFLITHPVSAQNLVILVEDWSQSESSEITSNHLRSTANAIAISGGGELVHLFITDSKPLISQLSIPDLKPNGCKKGSRLDGVNCIKAYNAHVRSLQNSTDKFIQALQDFKTDNKRFVTTDLKSTMQTINSILKQPHSLSYSQFIFILSDGCQSVTKGADCKCLNKPLNNYNQNLITVNWRQGCPPMDRDFASYITINSAVKYLNSLISK